MGKIHCCGGLRKSRTFIIEPSDGFLICELDLLLKCSQCGHTVVQLTRVAFDGKISIVRKTNRKARIFFEKMRNLILFEEKSKAYKVPQGGTFWLGYNEFGRKKKCYSNLSALKMGMFEVL